MRGMDQTGKGRDGGGRVRTGGDCPGGEQANTTCQEPETKSGLKSRMGNC